MTEESLIALLKTLDRPTTNQFMNHLANTGHNVRKAQKVFEQCVEKGSIQIVHGLRLKA